MDKVSLENYNNYLKIFPPMAVKKTDVILNKGHALSIK